MDSSEEDIKPPYEKALGFLDKAELLLRDFRLSRNENHRNAALANINHAEGIVEKYNLQGGEKETINKQVVRLRSQS